MNDADPEKASLTGVIVEAGENDVGTRGGKS